MFSKLPLFLLSLSTLTFTTTAAADDSVRNVNLSHKADAIYRQVLKTTQSNPKKASVAPGYLLRTGEVIDDVAQYGNKLEHCELFTNMLVHTKEEALIGTFTWDKDSLCADHARTALYLLDERARDNNSTIQVYILIAALSELNLRNKYPSEFSINLKNFTNKRSDAKPSTFGFTETYENLDFLIKTFHHKVHGSMHSNMLIVDGEFALVGSKGWDALPFYEYSALLRGSIAEPFRKDFEGLWGKPLPSLKDKPQFKQVGIPMIYLARKPNGDLSFKSNENAQNQAWLKALEVAQKYVMIQSPVVTTKSFVKKILETIKRGVQVIMIASYRMHDVGGKLYPDSFGSNENTFSYLRKQLSPVEQTRLHTCFFIGTTVLPPRPLKTELIHTNYMDVDGEFAIIGSGNLDPQSFYFSSQANVLIDDPQETKRITAKLFKDHPTLKNCYYDYKGNHYDANAFWKPPQ